VGSVGDDHSPADDDMNDVGRALQR